MAMNPVLKALKQGREEGYKAARVMTLGFLEEKYLAKDVGRGTPKGDAILELAQEISAMLNKNTNVPSLPEDH